MKEGNRVIAVIFFAGVLVLKVSSQEQKILAGTSFEGSYFSNALSCRFINSFLSHQFLSDEIKNSNRPRMNNAFFLNNENQLYIQSATDRLTLKFRYASASSFPADAYHLVFEGNEAYAGLTATMHPMYFMQQSYQTLEYGKIKSFSTNQWDVKLYGGNGLVKGQQLTHLSCSKGLLYTAPDGSFLDLDLTMTYRYAENGNHLLAINGIGTSLHVDLQAESKDKKTTMQWTVSDAGIMGWMNQSREMTIDTSFRFDGLAIDLFADSIAFSINDDTISRWIKQHEHPFRKIKALPAVFSFTLTRKISHSWDVTAGTKLYGCSRMSFPYLIADISYHPGEKHRITFLLRYGFYNNLNTGLSYLFVHPKWFIRADCLHVPSLIIGRRSFSEGFFLSFGIYL